jgi:hypothetical protein
MRNDHGLKRVEIEVTLTDRAPLAAVSRDAHVELTVLRGRVTARRAWYRLEVRGEGGSVDRAVGRLRGASCP